MTDNFKNRVVASKATTAGLIFVLSLTGCRQVDAVSPCGKANMWSNTNIFAWGVMANDTVPRDPEERAQMLARVGIKQFAFDWQFNDIAIFEEQIEALKRHGIKLLAWSIYDVDGPNMPVNWETYKVQDLNVLGGWRSPAPNALTVREMLEMFKMHDVSPQLWLTRRMGSTQPKSKSNTFSSWSHLSDEQRNLSFRTFLESETSEHEEEVSARTRQEANHIEPLARLAAQYGVKVGLYKHGGWIGVTDHQIAVVQHLKALGVTNVGIVYQFIHAHDEVDDTTNFPDVWKKLQPYVLAVNITGMRRGRASVFPIIYPSQGEIELDMMRALQESCWKGWIGLSAEKGGDAEHNLRNNLLGFSWIVSELKEPGSGGARPFPPYHAR